MHKKIGILGGTSPESTVEYYRYLTRSYTERFGDHGYPEIIIYSVSFQGYVDWCFGERWDLVAQGLIESAKKLEAAGADFLIIAANTLHIVYDQVQAGVGIPMISILDATADAIEAKGFRTAGLLGTKFTMEKPFYRDALARRGISVIVPEADDRQYINKVLYEELSEGKIRDESRDGFIRIMETLEERGAEGVVLGCTEIPLLVGEKDTNMTLFDTTRIHAEAALNYALNQGQSV